MQPGFHKIPGSLKLAQDIPWKQAQKTLKIAVFIEISPFLYHDIPMASLCLVYPITSFPMMGDLLAHLARCQHVSNCVKTLLTEFN